MNRRAKVIATISTLCLALVMLTVSVLAATSVSFTIGGTVAYELKDVLVDVNTNFYYSTDNTVLKGDAITTKADLVAGETLPTDLASVEGFTPKSVSTYKNGQVVELTDEEKTISGLQVKFGKYDSESEEKKSYSYYLVMEVTNHGENPVAVNVVDNTTAENVEKLATTAINFVNNGLEIAKDETKKVVISFNLTDLTQSVESTDFSFAVTIGEVQKLPDLIVNSTNASNENMTYTSNYAPIVTFEDVQAKVEEDEVYDMYGAVYNTTLSNIPENVIRIDLTYDTSLYEIYGLYLHQENFIQASNSLGAIYGTNDDDYINSNTFWSSIDLSKQQNRTLNLCLVVCPYEEAEEIVFDFTFNFEYLPEPMEPEIDENEGQIYIYSRGIDGNTLTYSGNYAPTVTIEQAQAKVELSDEIIGSIYNISLYNIPEEFENCYIKFDSDTSFDNFLGLYSNQNSLSEAIATINSSSYSDLIEGQFIDLSRQQDSALHLCFVYILEGSFSGPDAPITAPLNLFTAMPQASLFDSSNDVNALNVDFTLAFIVDEEVVDGQVVYSYDYETFSYSARSNGSYQYNSQEDLTILGSIKCYDYTYPVTSIESSAFNNRSSNIKSVTISDGITSIGSHAFSYCRGIESVVISDTVKSIGENAFSSCDALTNIVVEEGNENYTSRINGEETNCIIEIGESGGNSTYKVIQGCKNSTLLEGVTGIGYCAFTDCSGLTSIVIPDSVTMIEQNAFSRCKDLKSVVIGDNCQIIDSYAFSEDAVLESIVIGKSVTTIGSFVFLDCTSLTSIVVEEENTKYTSKINGEETNCIIEIGINGANTTYTVIQGSKNSTIPDGVTSIGNNAFEGFAALEKIVIGEGCQTIGSYAFKGCSELKTIIIPNTVTNIGYNAFNGCNELIAYMESTSSSSITFGNSRYSNVTFYYYSETESSGKWHYVEGVPTLW